jgi:hypothetical protein
MPMTLTLVGMILPESAFPSGCLRNDAKMPALAPFQYMEELREHHLKIPPLQIYAHTCF